MAGAIGHGQRRSQGAAGPWIGVAHDGCRAVTCREEARDCQASLIQDPCVVVDAQAALGADVPRVQRCAIKGRFLDGAQAGIGLHRCIPVLPVMRVGAAPEIEVDAAPGKISQPVRGGFQTVGIDTQFTRQRSQGGCLAEHGALAEGAWVEPVR